MTTSYDVRQGDRPAGQGQPGGFYDGTFTRDYVYRDGLGTLDECNGRLGKTPDFPEGTYAYFLSASWPVVPRCFSGTPVESRPLNTRTSVVRKRIARPLAVTSSSWHRKLSNGQQSTGFALPMAWRG